MQGARKIHTDFSGSATWRGLYLGGGAAATIFSFGWEIRILMAFARGVPSGTESTPSEPDPGHTGVGKRPTLRFPFANLTHFALPCPFAARCARSYRHDPAEHPPPYQWSAVLHTIRVR